MGGVLFIDEACHLYRAENERHYGREASRDPPQGDGEPARRRRPRRLQGPHELLRLEPGHEPPFAHHTDFTDYPPPRAEDDRTPHAGTPTPCLSAATTSKASNTIERSRLRAAGRLVAAGRDHLITLRWKDFTPGRAVPARE
ncbi:MAG: hypothetical protein IRY90_17575 [Actinomadura rubrobrunea]|nr:hypothetical protein [Actinomadura rubrobrunea]